MRQLLKRCGISSSQLTVHCKRMNGTWVYQSSDTKVASDGIYKFVGTFRTKAEKKQQKEDDERRLAARKRQIENKKQNKCMLG